jgi:hypothetical protein
VRVGEIAERMVAAFDSRQSSTSSPFAMTAK